VVGSFEFCEAEPYRRLVSEFCEAEPYRGAFEFFEAESHRGSFEFCEAEPYRRLVSEFCEAEPYRVLVFERFGAFVFSGKVLLSDVDASSPAKSLDPEVLLFCSAKARGGAISGIFIETIKRLLMNKINFLLL
jgi:hypothetical protein